MFSKGRIVRPAAYRFAYSAALLLALLASTTGAGAPAPSTPAQAPYAGPVGYEIWHASYQANVITVVDPADLSVTQTIPLPGGPYTIALGHDRGTERDIVFVSLWDTGEIALIDAATKQIDKFITPPYFVDPQLLASPDRSKIYVNNCAPGVPSVEIDVASQATFKLKITNTWNMEFSADGMTGYFADRWGCSDGATWGIRMVDLVGGQLLRLVEPDHPRARSSAVVDITRIPLTDNYAVVYGNQFLVVDAELQTIGLTDPSTQSRANDHGVPVWAIQFRQAHEAFIHDGLGESGNILRHVDVSDPTLPFYPGLDTYAGEPGFNPNRTPVADGFQIIGNYAYFADRDSGVNLEAWDLDVDPPNKAAELRMPDDSRFTYFAVRKVPVAEQIANIEEDAATTLDAAGVPESKDQVTKALEDAANRADDGDTAKAITALEKTIKSLSQLVKKGDLSAAGAQSLIDPINALIQELSGSG